MMEALIELHALGAVPHSTTKTSLLADRNAFNELNAVCRSGKPTGGIEEIE